MRDKIAPSSYNRRMRWLLVAVLAGCATKSPPGPVTASAMDDVQVRACESCRHDLEICRSSGMRLTSPSECVDAFVGCLRAQSLEASRCAGLN
jgi:hypothetical protein